MQQYSEELVVLSFNILSAMFDALLVVQLCSVVFEKTLGSVLFDERSILRSVVSVNDVLSISWIYLSSHMVDYCVVASLLSLVAIVDERLGVGTIVRV